MSRDLGRDIPDSEKLYARKLRADFSYPKNSKFLFCPFLRQDCLKPGPGEDRARNGRGPGEWKGVRGQGRKTLVFGGYESVSRAK